MTAAIEVLDLVRRYGERAVVDGVSFEAAAGEVVAVLGPNGAGKTTTVETIEGYRRPSGGAVRVLGRDPWRAGREHRARVGLMLQEDALDPRITPREALRLQAALYRTPRDPDALVETLGLADVASSRARTLSGGERRRLGLGLALVGRPDVLILDEPTAGMDPAARARTRDLVAAERADGAAILLTSHELTDVERLADRVVILRAGRVVAAGPPGAIGRGGRTLRLRPQRALAAGEAAALGAALGAAAVRDEGSGWYLIEAAPSPALVAALAAWCSEREILVGELRAGGGSLEERYLELTGEGPG